MGKKKEKEKGALMSSNLQCTLPDASAVPARQGRQPHAPLLHSQHGTALDTQPWSSGEQSHTKTRGQLVAKDEHLNSHLIFPAIFIKQAPRADL